MRVYLEIDFKTKGKQKMIVQRITVQIKNGKNLEAMELVKEGRSLFPLLKRVYTSRYGALNSMAFESEAESSAEIDKMWETTFATEEWATWSAKWNAVVVHGGANELWNREDF